MKKILLTAIVLFAALPAFAAEKETAFERVIRTNTLRCGYWNWQPLFNKDAVSGEFTGIFKDVMDYIGPSLGLKVEWVKEVGFASFEQDLIADKVDAVCAGVWPKAARSRVMDFSDAVFYVPLHIYVREDDTRFEDDINLLNSPEITFAGMDGLVESAVVAQDFPKAKRNSIPDTASISEIFLMVQNKKADAVITDVFTADSFLKNNPNSLKALKTKIPLRYFGNTISVKKGEQELIDMLNTALEEAHSAGVIEPIIKKYETVPGSLLRTSKPYEAAQ